MKQPRYKRNFSTYTNGDKSESTAWYYIGEVSLWAVGVGRCKVESENSY